jgi:hypothetical protein
VESAEKDSRMSRVSPRAKTIMNAILILAALAAVAFIGTLL